jgi:hypothetical protein
MKKKEMKDALRNISDELGSSRIPIKSLYGTPKKNNYSPSPAKKTKTVRLDTESQVCTAKCLINLNILGQKKQKL